MHMTSLHRKSLLTHTCACIIHHSISTKCLIRIQQCSRHIQIHVLQISSNICSKCILQWMPHITQYARKCTIAFYSKSNNTVYWCTNVVTTDVTQAQSIVMYINTYNLILKTRKSNIMIKIHDQKLWCSTAIDWDPQSKKIQRSYKQQVFLMKLVKIRSTALVFCLLTADNF
jgi:hypothetical protein